jgi:hypothetical protein
MRRADRCGKISTESDVMGAAFNNSGVAVKSPRLLATFAAVALYLYLSLVPPSVFRQKAVRSTGLVLRISTAAWVLLNGWWASPERSLFPNQHIGESFRGNAAKECVTDP